MATYTTNYNLEKPDSTDDFKDFRSNYNSNMDIIDANLGGGGGSSVSWSQLQVTGDKIATIRVSGIDTDVFTPNSQTFSMAVSRININSGETYPTIFGKIKKWFNDLKTVAFSGSYNDLSDQPTIPTATSDLNNDSDFVSDASYVHTDNNFTNADVTKLSGIQSGAEVNVQSDWNEADNTADDYIKNKPTIPTVNDGTLTIQQNGTTVGTFTANQSGNTTVNLSGGGGSAHTIVNESGTSLADEPNLQFTDGLKATDDSVNSKTVVGVNTTFTEASTRANIASGESFATILGKIKKWFSDLASMFVSKSGDTMSGNLIIQKAGEAYCKAINSNTNVGVYLDSDADGKHGIWSGGYNNGTYHSSGRWILNRDESGDVYVNGTKVPHNNGTVAVISQIPDISTKVSKSGDTMSGNLTVDRQNGTTSATAWSAVVLGNNTPSGTDKNSFGVVRLYGENQAFTDLYAPNATQNRDITFPNKNGTVALTSDIPTNNYLTTDGQSEDNCVPANGTFQPFRCTTSTTGGGDGYIWAQSWNSGNYVTQLYLEVDNSYLLSYRYRKNNGVWDAWKRIPMGDGTGASGTWNIDISGNANYATSAGSATDSTKLPLTGGTLQGSSDTPLRIKSNDNNGAYIGYQGTNGTTFGYIGVRSDKNPYVYTDQNYLILTSKCTYHDYKTSSGTKRYNITKSGDGMMIISCSQAGASNTRVVIANANEVINIYSAGSGYIVSNSYIQTSLQNVYIDIMATVPITVS